MPEFNIETEASQLKDQTKTIRNNRYRRSKLDDYTFEIISLYKTGVSRAEIRRWLKEKKIVASWSTVARWLERNA